MLYILTSTATRHLHWLIPGVKMRHSTVTRTLALAVKLLFAHFPVLKIVNMISPITNAQKYDTPSKNFMGGGAVTPKMNVIPKYLLQQIPVGYIKSNIPQKIPTYRCLAAQRTSIARLAFSSNIRSPDSLHKYFCRYLVCTYRDIYEEM